MIEKHGENIGITVFLGLLLLLAGTPLIAGELPDTEERTQELNRILARAESLFDSPDQSRAIPDLNEIVRRLEGYVQTGQLRPAWRDIYVSALVMRGQILYGLGEFQKAEEDFKKILEANPDYRMDPMQVSPKIVADFDEVRGKAIGHLTVRSAPPVAEVKIDGQLLGVTPLVGKNLTRGEYRLTVSLLGYRDHEEIIVVEPGVLIDRDVNLEMNAGDCILFTSPAGVSVYLDGKLKGETSGEAPARDAEFIRKHGLDPKEASAPFIIPLVSLGQHKLTLSKRGWTTKAYTLNVHEGENKIAPVVLQPSRCSLVVKSTPSGASVFLDNETNPLGETPLQARDVYTGDVKVRVVFDGKGTWSEVLDLKKDERVEVDCAPRPTCLFAGILDPSQENPSLAKELTDQWIESLRGFQRVNRILPGDVDYPDDVLFGTRRFQDTASLRKGVLDLARGGEADLVLLGLLGASDGLSGPPLHIELLSVHHEGVDRTTFPANDPEAHRRWLNEVNQADLRIRMPWLGAVVVDTSILPGAHVAFVVPQGPAAEAGLSPGDAIVEVNGRQVVEVSGLLTLLDETQPGQTLSLRLKRDDKEVDLDAEVGSSPRLLPLADRDILYNMALEEMLLRRTLSSGEDRQIAQLNLALCLMHFGEYERALSTSLQPLRLDRPYGVNDATVQYYIGECFRHLGRDAEAAAAYEKAINAAGGTFEYDGGLQVKPAAEARLAELIPNQPAR